MSDQDWRFASDVMVAWRHSSVRFLFCLTRSGAIFAMKAL
jgi:hypothetical protein